MILAPGQKLKEESTQNLEQKLGINLNSFEQQEHVFENSILIFTNNSSPSLYYFNFKNYQLKITN